MAKAKNIVPRTIGVIIKLFVILVFMFPFLWMASLSLQTQKETLVTTFLPKVPQFQNFVTAWSSGPFALYLRNSVVIVLTIMVVQMVIMVPAAYAFAKYDFKGKNILFTLVLVAFMTPTQITFLPVYYMMGDWNLLRSLWPQIIPFLSNAFGIFLLRQYFMQIPDELIEAAKLDNAGELKIVYKVMLPLCKPAISTILLFGFVDHWNDYFWPLMMTTVEDLSSAYHGNCCPEGYRRDCKLERCDGRKHVAGFTHSAHLCFCVPLYYQGLCLQWDQVRQRQCRHSNLR